MSAIEERSIVTCEPETSVEAEEAEPLADERLALEEAMAEQPQPRDR